MRCFICNFVRWRRSRGWLRLPMPAKGLASRIHPVLRPAIFFCCDARSCTRSFGRSNRYSFNSFLAYFHLNSYFLNKSFVGIYIYIHIYSQFLPPFYSSALGRMMGCMETFHSLHQMRQKKFIQRQTSSLNHSNVTDEKWKRKLQQMFK